MKNNRLFIGGVLALALALALAGCGGDDASTPSDTRTELTAGGAVNALADAITANVTFTGAAGLSLTAADFAVTTGGTVNNVSVTGGTATVTVSFAANTAAAAKTYTVSIASGSGKIKGSANVKITQAAGSGDPSKAATPTANPQASEVAANTTVTLSTATEGATIHYTTNGTTPTASSTTYSDSSPIVITAATTIKAIAVKSGMTNSDVLTAAYTIPTFTSATITTAEQWAQAMTAIGKLDGGTAGAYQTVTLTIEGTVELDGLGQDAFLWDVSGIYPNYTGRYITLELTGLGTLKLKSAGYLIRLASNADARLIIDGPTLQGIIDNTGPLVVFTGRDGYNNSGELKSGKITGNTGGGGVYVGSGGTFTLSGGEITGNSTYTGGGVYVTGGSFSMTGGEITGNSATGYGGGVHATSGSFSMTGGEITSNSAAGNGGGVYIVGNSSTSSGARFFKDGGGVIYGDTDATYTPGDQANTATGSGSNTGHAVYYFRMDYYGGLRYRNTTLTASDNLSTDDPDSGWNQ